jgi:hypothetical protein
MARCRARRYSVGCRERRERDFSVFCVEADLSRTLARERPGRFRSLGSNSGVDRAPPGTAQRPFHGPISATQPVRHTREPANRAQSGRFTPARSIGPSGSRRAPYLSCPAGSMRVARCTQGSGYFSFRRASPSAARAQRASNRTSPRFQLATLFSRMVFADSDTHGPTSHGSRARTRHLFSGILGTKCYYSAIAQPYREK